MSLPNTCFILYLLVHLCRIGLFQIRIKRLQNHIDTGLTTRTNKKKKPSKKVTKKLHAINNISRLSQSITKSPACYKHKNYNICGQTNSQTLNSQRLRIWFKICEETSRVTFSTDNLKNHITDSVTMKCGSEKLIHSWSVANKSINIAFVLQRLSNCPAECVLSKYTILFKKLNHGSHDETITHKT